MAEPAPGGGAPAPDSVENQLVASWQPGFCATNAGQNKDECQTQTADGPTPRNSQFTAFGRTTSTTRRSFPATAISRPRSACNQGSRRRRAASDLSVRVLAKLKVAMPGVQSDLTARMDEARHLLRGLSERRRRRARSRRVLRARRWRFSRSSTPRPVRDLFVEHLGQDLTAAEIEAAFDAAFGAGAGKRVVVRCDSDSGVITEMWIGLKGDISADVRSRCA